MWNRQRANTRDSPSSIRNYFSPLLREVGSHRIEGPDNFSPETGHISPPRSFHAEIRSISSMSMTALKGDTAFQARSLVCSIIQASLCLTNGKSADSSSVPLPSPSILSVRRIQFPRVRQTAHKRCLPRTQYRRAWGEGSAGADTAGIEGAADDEGEILLFVCRAVSIWRKR